MKPKKILIVGSPVGVDIHNALLQLEMQEKYGNDIILVTSEQALEQGLGVEDFAHLHIQNTLPIVPLPIIPLHDYAEHKDGQQNRRERRKKERNNKKK